MNKKIIAIFCVLILMVSVFSACGNKGYLLMKDEKGVEHAYVTDENGSTVLNENGDIRVYETDANGKIVKDTDGNPKENILPKPEYFANDNKYKTDDFELAITDEWKNATEGKYIKGENTECFIQISKEFNDLESGEGALEYKLTDTINLNEQVVNQLKAQYPVAVFNHGYKEIGGNTMYVLEYYAENPDKSVAFYSELFYFVVGRNVYCITYADTNGKEYTQGFDFSSYIENNLTIKTK